MRACRQPDRRRSWLGANSGLRPQMLHHMGPMSPDGHFMQPLGMPGYQPVYLPPAYFHGLSPQGMAPMQVRPPFQCQQALPRPILCSLMLECTFGLQILHGMPAAFSERWSHELLMRCSSPAGNLIHCTGRGDVYAHARRHAWVWGFPVPAGYGFMPQQAEGMQPVPHALGMLGPSNGHMYGLNPRCAPARMRAQGPHRPTQSWLAFLHRWQQDTHGALPGRRMGQAALRRRGLGGQAGQYTAPGRPGFRGSLASAGADRGRGAGAGAARQQAHHWSGELPLPAVFEQHQARSPCLAAAHGSRTAQCRARPARCRRSHLHASWLLNLEAAAGTPSVSSAAAVPGAARPSQPGPAQSTPLPVERAAATEAA